MTQGRGASVSDYGAPLFLAWQLTNRCAGRCLHCCEDSGPGKAWPRELSREEALRVARQVAELGIPYAAFGGGEPLSVPHCWEVFEILSAGGVSIKLETDGTLIDPAAAERLKSLAVSSIQISVDGVDAPTHEAVRPGGNFEAATQTIRRLAGMGLEPELVFVPVKQNLAQTPRAYELARSLGARTFVTGPLMRLGRAALDWESLGPDAAQWRECVLELKNLEDRFQGRPSLSVYPWDIQTEIRTRLESPQAMVLVVPDGKVKLLNALPFAPGDLRKHSLLKAWELAKKAWRSPKVADFCAKASQDASLLKHANECWEI